MYRHSPVRSQRSKGIKTKHVLQVCLLVAVCFWLIFQVKRSHDKKKEFDANDNKISLTTRNSDETVKFGRKYLHPKLEEATKEVEETQENEDEHEEDEDKIEDEKDDGGGGGDDEIDENENEKSNVEIDREEVDILDEDKETEESDEDGQGQSQSQSETELEDSIVNRDEDGSTVHTNEAREEQYKADDASSAVTHVGLNETSTNTTMFQEKDIITPVNATSSIDSSDNGPPSSTTMTSSNTTVSGELVTSNATITEITQESSNSTNTSDENTSDFSNTDVETENLDTDNVTEGTEESFDPNEIEHETIDSIDSEHLDEKEVRTDLETLPEIETEGGNSEDTAAE